MSVFGGHLGTRMRRQELIAMVAFWLLMGLTGGMIISSVLGMIASLAMLARSG